MASRANKEARPEPPSYGAPMGPPVVSSEEQRRRDRERQEKLETKPTAEERQDLIEEHEKRGRAETVQKRRDKLTEAPKPAPEYETVRQPGGGTPAEILKERPQDVEEAIRRAEGAEPLTPELTVEEEEPAKPIRERKPPKLK